ATGLAGHSEFILPPQSTNNGNLDRFLAFQTYLNSTDRADLMLSKPLGLGHGGGAVLRSQDLLYLQLAAAVEQSASLDCNSADDYEDGSSTVTPTVTASDLPMFETGLVLDYGMILRRAALLFGQPVPSQESLNQAR